MTYPRELQRLCKWRSILTGRILGSRSDTDPVAQGYRDIFEKLLILRAETTALTSVLIDKGLITAAEHMEAVEREAAILCDQYAERFPGFTATDTGVDIDVNKAVETMKGWPL